MYNASNISQNFDNFKSGYLFAVIFKKCLSSLRNVSVCGNMTRHLLTDSIKRFMNMYMYV